MWNVIFLAKTKLMYISCTPAVYNITPVERGRPQNNTNQKNKSRKIKPTKEVPLYVAVPP